MVKTKTLVDEAAEKLGKIYDKYNHLFIVNIHGILWNILINQKFEGREVAFVSNYTDSELVLGIAEKDLPGYIRTTTAFKDKNFERAEDICEELNEAVFGLDGKQASLIVLSSIGAAERFKRTA